MAKRAQAKPRTTAEHDCQPLSDFIKTAKVSDDTKAILRAIELQTQCVISAVYLAAEAMKTE